MDHWETGNRYLSGLGRSIDWDWRESRRNSKFLRNTEGWGNVIVHEITDRDANQSKVNVTDFSKNYPEAE